MDATLRIERALSAAVARTHAPGCPPRLAAALQYAIFPGGARIRPRLCLAVSHACAETDRVAPDAAATAIELLHCASLVHDDLPCFDDAPTRRGKPSVHAAFGERIAVLTGDALIVLAFETLARAITGAPDRLAALLLIVGRSVGMPAGIVAGQAWECESRVNLADYQRAKTASLFAAATMAGAAATGADPGAWRGLGEQIGEAFQVADDLRDAAGNPEELGKPVGRDAILGRPSAVGELGIPGAIHLLETQVAGAIGAIPDCPGKDELRALILAEADGLLPKQLRRAA